MISYYLRTIQDRVLREIPEFAKECLIYCKEPKKEVKRAIFETKK
jgi:hypothetical protein